MSAKEKKVVLITGCAPGGIGNALAREFHASGLHVIATARSKDGITDLEELGMTTLSLDVTSEESIAVARKDVEELLAGAGLDILVNNAGRNLTLPALDVPLSEVRLTLETNFIAVVAITQAFTPLLIAASPSLILNIGSITAIVPYVFGSVYNASKAALHAYSSSLRLELEPYGVRVMVVITGGVKSRIARTGRQLPEGSLYKLVDPEFQRRVKHSQEGAMDATEYARGVVKDALRKNPSKWFWRGNKTGIIRFVHRWLGGWVFDLVLPRMFGLVRMKKILMGRKKKE